MAEARALAVVLAVAAVFAATTLAGCSGKAPAADGVAERPALASGKGAIAGLLVDDRYRPLHLTDQPSGEFDAKGFLLVVETGATVTSDGDGQFTVVDLDPGTYTLKPSVEGHEGAPVKVDVAAGRYAEVDVLVRRLATPAKDTVVIHDDTILMTCTLQVLDGHFTTGRTCMGDLSGEGTNNWIEYNYTGFGAIAAVVVEAKFSRVGDWEVWWAPHGNLVTDLYAKDVVYQTDHYRAAMVAGSEDGRFATKPFDPMDFSVWVDPDGLGTQQADEATGIPMSVSYTFIAEARVVVSAFLAVPANLDTYSVLG